MKNKLSTTNNGITLIALVITIIVLLILAGVTIATLTGDNGILTQANNASIQQSHGAVKDAIILAYNEYQIEINTASNSKIASTETSQIQGKEEKVLASYSSFLDFLENKGYIREGMSDVLDIETLTGENQALGNGEDTDVYKIEEYGKNYVVNYYDEDGKAEQIWSVSKTANVELEPDAGKEELILIYNVSAGDTIELPYSLIWDDTEGNQHDALFDFTIDWGDGTIERGITNDNIEEKGKHKYITEGKKEIKILGTFETISSMNLENGNLRAGILELQEVKQWGTTNVKEIYFFNANELTKIATPTQNSFISLINVSFGNSGLASIPENLFANCPNVEYFAYTFNDTNITNIPENLFSNCMNVKGFFNTFENTKITSIPEGLFENCHNAVYFVGTFRNTKITSIPENLFDSCNFNNVLSFEICFAGCKQLTGKVPELWLTGSNSEENDYKGKPDGKGCFAESDGLEKYEEIPEYWRKYNFPQ